MVALCLAGTVHAQEQAPAASEMQKAVEEFKVQTRNLGLRADSPPRKRHGGRWQWHGRLFENLRNDILDAVPHEIVQRGGSKSLLRRNQFGFNIAGPVAIPKLYEGGRSTYFSLSYEGVRERISRTQLRTIPTGPERTGDFSATVDAAGSPLPVFDPLTTRPNPSFNPALPVARDNLEYLRDVFPDNRIPSYRLDPVAREALRFYPEANTSVGPFFRNNYFVVSPETNTANGMILRLDRSIRDRHKLTFGTSLSNGFLGAAKWFPTPANPGPSDNRFQSRRGSLEHTFTKSAQTVNTLSFEADSESSRAGGAGQPDHAGEIGLRGVGKESFPVFRMWPYLSMGQSFPVSKNAHNTYMLTNAFSTRRGKHGIRVVARHFRWQVNSYWPRYPAGSFEFGDGLTSLPGIVNTGHAFASYLLGLAEFAENSVVTSPSYYRRNYWALALRHQYEVTKGLNLTFGANLEHNLPRTEKYDRQSTVDLNAINPANGRPGALVVAARNGRGRAFQPAHTKLEPSASLAWNPRGDSRTVVRLSFARSYAPIPIYTGHWATQAFNAAPAFISPNIQLEPAVRLTAGLPPLAHPLPDLRPEAVNDLIADLVDMSDRQPTYQSASLNVERELPSQVVVSLGAAYSGGRNLLVGNPTANPNAVPLEALAYRDQLNDEAFNRSLRPYPQYKGFETYWAWPIGRYMRNAGFVRVEKRATRGLTLNLYYEVAKQMDDYSGGRQDYEDREAEWSLTNGSRPQHLSLTYTYELPFGSGKPLLAYSDWRRHLVEGWSVSGVSTVVGGDPLALRPLFNNTGGVIQNLRVNVVSSASPAAVNQGPEHWFNPAAFDQPPDFAPGNASRTHPSLRNPSSQNHDLSLSKRFALGPERTVELSAVGLNFLNHANWNDPDTVIGPSFAPNANAGKIIGSRGGRVVQVGLRLSF
jgi:hypothetical protein